MYLRCPLDKVREPDPGQVGAAIVEDEGVVELLLGAELEACVLVRA